MKIRKATIHDKKSVLSFCKDTFSWGDYISQVWDFWIFKGYLLVLLENQNPVAISHTTIESKTKQAWIEGIRVDPNFRKKGFAEKLVRKSEQIAKKQTCTMSQMLIESSNLPSLNLAKKLNYKKNTTWIFYSLIPLKHTTQTTVNILTTNNKTVLGYLQKSNFYIDSWRWILLNKNIIHSLIKNNRIIFSKVRNSVNSMAIYTNSEYFDKTLMFTIVDGTPSGLLEIISYIQNLSAILGFKRIQILTRKNLPKYIGLEKKLRFHLLIKKL